MAIAQSHRYLRRRFRRAHMQMIHVAYWESQIRLLSAAVPHSDDLGKRRRRSFGDVKINSLYEALHNILGSLIIKQDARGRLDLRQTMCMPSSKKPIPLWPDEGYCYVREETKWHLCIQLFLCNDDISASAHAVSKHESNRYDAYNGKRALHDDAMILQMKRERNAAWKALAQSGTPLQKDLLTAWERLLATKCLPAETWPKNDYSFNFCWNNTSSSHM